MLYAQENVPVPSDPYDMPDFERDDQKQAINEILNASTRDSAERSLRRKIKNIRTLTDALIKRHKLIEGHFFCGDGVHLQYLDSQIAELVMMRFLELGRLALPVHDSFIVRVGQEAELKNAMDEAFTSLFPNVESRTKPKTTVMEEEAKNRMNDGKDEFKFNDFDLEDLTKYSYYYDL